MYRGSRKHILDWVERPDFPGQLSQLLNPVPATVQVTDVWMPTGYTNPVEARLEQFGPQVLPTANWRIVQDWWLVSKRRANTPNWDLASTCTNQGQRGLVLIEAKAHVQELKTEGKPLKADASPESQENHKRIGYAISEAKTALAKVDQGVNISRDTHYQLANRIAFSWKIASLGVPVILIYLGFIGDTNISDVGEPFREHNHWQQAMRAYMKGQFPEGLVEKPIDCGLASMQILIRSLPVRQG